MAIQISRREVLNNIIRFKDALLEHGKVQRTAPGERSYPILVNCKTGDIRFEEKVTQLARHLPQKGKAKSSPEDWKEIRIQVSTESPKIVHFELLEQEKHLNPEGMELLAWRVINETIEVLNQIGAKTIQGSPEMLPEESVLQDLSDIHLAPHPSSIEDLPGWVGPVNRFQAEEILRSEAVGTYLLREGDAQTPEIALRLGRENKIHVHAYVCTVVEFAQKISDILILHTPKGWTRYRDNPDLSDSEYEYFRSPHALLTHMERQARRPIAKN